MATIVKFNIFLETNKDFVLQVDHIRYKRVTIEGKSSGIYSFESFINFSLQSFRLQSDTNISLYDVNFQYNDQIGPLIIVKQEINSIDLHPERSIFFKQNKDKFCSDAIFHKYQKMFVPMKINSLDTGIIQFAARITNKSTMRL